MMQTMEITFYNKKTVVFPVDYERDSILPKDKERFLNHILHGARNSYFKGRAFQASKEKVLSMEEVTDLLLLDIEEIGADAFMEWVYEDDLCELAHI